MILRKWEVRPLDKERAAAFAQTYGVPFFLAMLMNIRGLDDAAHLREFLGEGEPLSDPFLLKDMDKAAARITRAVDNMEKIAVLNVTHGASFHIPLYSSCRSFARYPVILQTK